MYAVGPFVTKKTALRLCTITGAKLDASGMEKVHIGALGDDCGHHLTPVWLEVAKKTQ